MSKSGIIKKKNKKRGMIGIKTNTGYTIVELLNDWDINIGDKIFWENDYGLGHEKYTNTSNNISTDVYVQNHDVSNSNVFNQLLYNQYERSHVLSSKCTNCNFEILTPIDIGEFPLPGTTSYRTCPNCKSINEHLWPHS